MSTISATLLPNGKQQFFNASGQPLAGGSVAFYIPTTLTPKNTWQDPLESTLNSNPVVLDAGGMALIYGSGQYRQIVKDSLGNTIWDQLTQDFLSLVQTNLSYWGATSGGGANAQTVTTSPTFSSYVAPMVISFIAGFTNTGATTINANSVGNKNVYKQTGSGPVALTGGEIIAGNIYNISYDGTEFQLLNPVSAEPTGSVIAFAASTAPTGYIECNGSAISRTTFSGLFNIIGTTFGSGDGSTTFNIPDLRGYFVRGWADTGSVDSGRAFGSTQTGDVAPHSHTINDPTHSHAIVPTALTAGGSGGTVGGSQLFNGVTDTQASATGITINNSTGTETRPVNVALMYCIKT